LEQNGKLGEILKRLKKNMLRAERHGNEENPKGNPNGRERERERYKKLK